jgi:hypothetical protein
MATYNSTQNGNWNTDATWTEAGHPTANDDITIITHNVTYDVGVGAITWGNCTINSGGILIFPIAANSKMLFNATGILTVNNGGEFRVGTDGAPIGGGFLCQIHWPQGSLGRYVLVLNNGGTISVYGDPTYYGSAKTAILESQWAVGSGLTLYVEGDYSSKWVAGQHFIIHDFAIYANYNTDAESFEIDSIGAYDAGNDRTPIVVTAAGDSDTFLVGAKLWMLSRNVELADPGSPWAVYGFGSYTERLRFDNNQDIVRGASSNVNFNESIFKGWEISAFGGDGLTCDGTVYLNNHHALYNDIYSVLTNCLIASCYYGTNGSSRIELGADIIACYEGLSSGNSINFTGDIISCYNSIKVANTNMIGNIYSSSNGVFAVADVSLIGNIETCHYGLVSVENMRMIGDIKGCTSGVFTSKSLSQIGSITGCGNAINNPAGVLKFKNGELSGNTNDVASLISASDLRAAIFEDYTIGGTKRELEIYANAGNILCWHTGDAHWQAPSSGESFILEALPNSYCNVARSEWLSLTPDPLNMMFTYIASGVKTLTFKIYPVGWSSSLDNEDIVLEAFYLAGAGVSRTRVINTTATYANAGWRNMAVSFTAGQDGIVYFIIHLKKYEAGCYVLLDPEWVVS